ncbi:MAG: nickel pincer cofactor biosynthesis protein LarB [Pseudomonadota bacterium]
MDIKKIIKEYKSGKISEEACLKKLKDLPYSDLGFAKIDHHRKHRKGNSEVIYAEGKTADQIIAITKQMQSTGENILATRVSSEIFEAVSKEIKNLEYNEIARTFTYIKTKKRKKGNVSVICAGTTDLPVAYEACVTAEFLGSKVTRLFDVGVAGIHRLIMNKVVIDKAKALIVVAGMDGALPSVVGGLAKVPLIAVPTSVGYGASFNGVAPLLTMLNCCSPGVAVVNIDNGFGAGYMAHMINSGK